MSQESQKESFEIDASVVFQLGESLISDSIQALLELVKNSYDADASYCKLIISTDVVDDESSPFKGAQGSISVEDDGSGMSIEDIRNGWLTISNSAKLSFKAKALTTPKGRTPLGDKGLGRLGTQRIGSNLEMITRTENSSVQQRVWFSWSAFSNKSKLSQVSIERREEPPTFRKGTRLIISGLRERELWEGDGVKDLEVRLSQMISPYKAVRNFVVYATVNGTELDLLEIPDKIRQLAQLRYTLSFDGELFSVSGRARLAYLRPEAAADMADKAKFKELVEDDGGKAFFAFLQEKKRAKDFGMSKLDDTGWFVGYARVLNFSEMDKLARVNDRLANPGPFSGEVDFFSLGNESSNSQDIFTKAEEYRTAIEKLSGIKVYRDGFGIRVPMDWLNLGSQWTKARSYYTLKPQNTLGYIAISARENAQLQEKTDREGFTENAYFRNFYTLLDAFVIFSADAQQFLRRGYNDFRKAHERKVAQVPENVTPEALSQSIEDKLAKAAHHQHSIANASLRLKSSIAAADRVAEKMQLYQSNPQRDEVQALLAQLRQEISATGSSLIAAEKYLEEASKLKESSKVLTSQIQSLQEQIQQVYEIISLGLTAEALSHEINNVITQLGQRTQQISRHLRSERSRDLKLSTYTEYVNSAVAALRRQMVFLAPSLRYAREKREIIDLNEFGNELVQHYTAHFSGLPIGINLDRGAQSTPFKIDMNKGKLIQILDNLFLNSEYWLKEGIKSNRFVRGTVTIQLQKPLLIVSDTGMGIDSSVEHSLFEPFVSTKGRGRGRGLGLYIAQQLLRADGCDIRLAQERNKHNRLYKFEIDLTGVISS